jgi:arylsulfatase A-like enzyme
LLITTDEQRYDTYGLDESPWPQLPNQARLRRDGVTLTNAYSNCPICQPCRYTWLSGLYGSQTERGPRNGYDWPDNHPTMPQALQRAGYHTAIIGKLHAYSGYTLEKYHMEELEEHTRTWGFDTVCECSGRGLWSFGCHKGRPGIKGSRYTEHLKSKGLYKKAWWENKARAESRCASGGREPYRPGVLAVEDTLDGFIISEMCEFIADRSRKEPFFLHASFWGPHYPLDVPPEYFEQFRPQDMPPPHGLEDTDLIRRWQENRAMYMALLKLVDDQIGRLLASLEQTGSLDDTVILLTTDHGDMLGDHGHARKCVSYEGSCRTPILVRAPGQAPAGTVRPGLVEAVDLPQTILAAAGLDESQRVKALPGAPGQSFWQYIRDDEPTFRESVYSEYGMCSAMGGMRMVRKDQWKYTRLSGGRNLLFNLETDPHELDNRATDAECRGTLRDMQELLIDRLADIPCPPMQGRRYTPNTNYQGNDHECP